MRIVAHGAVASLLLVGSTWLMAGTAHARMRTDAPAFVPLGELADAPRGFIDMCDQGREPLLCRSGHKPAGVAAIATGGIGQTVAPAARLNHIEANHIEANQMQAVLAQDMASSLANGADWSSFTPCTAAVDMVAAYLAPEVQATDATCVQPAAAGATTAELLLDWSTRYAGATMPSVLPSIALSAPFQLATSDIAGPVSTAGSNLPEALPLAVLALLAQEGGDREDRSVMALPAADLSSMTVKQQRALLAQVNRRVNGRVRQRTDIQIYGTGELWQRSGISPSAQGDCEDLAIEKRLELVQQGFPADRLSFAVVYSRSAGLHTILLARTDEGDVVLDSRSPHISAWSKTGYVWLSIQSADDPMVWRALSRAA